MGKKVYGRFRNEFEELAPALVRREESYRKRSVDEGHFHDFKRQQKNGYTQLLFPVVSQQNKRRIFVSAQSHESPSDQQN